MAVGSDAFEGLEDFGVVSAALIAAMIEEMIRDLGFDLTIIAEDNRKDVGIFCRHGLFSQQGIDLGIVGRHVSQRFPAGWTLIRRLDVVFVAPRVNAMSARLVLRTKKKVSMDTFSHHLRYKTRIKHSP